jgi:hypothetical protein
MTDAAEDAYAALLDLDALWDQGRGESEAADALCERIEALWGRMGFRECFDVVTRLFQHRRDVLSSHGR